MQMADEKKKNRAAVTLGRLGGKKRAANLSAEDLSAQGKKAAAIRWAKTRLLKAPLNGGDESSIPANPEPVVDATPDTVRRVEATVEGRDSKVILALREQGYEVGDPVAHPDGFTRVDIRSHDLSAWVNVGQELLDLAAGRVTLAEIKSRQRSFSATGRG